jgi:hypothetical protein
MTSAQVRFAIFGSCAPRYARPKARLSAVSQGLVSRLTQLFRFLPIRRAQALLFTGDGVFDVPGASPFEHPVTIFHVCLRRG